MNSNKRKLTDDINSEDTDYLEIIKKPHIDNTSNANNTDIKQKEIKSPLKIKSENKLENKSENKITADDLQIIKQIANENKLLNDVSVNNVDIADIKEPLLIDENRFTIEPILYDDMFDMYKTHKSAFWDEHEVKLDKDDFSSLTPNEQYFVENILAFFATSDLIVNENLSLNFLRDIKILEARMFYSFQQMMENIHCVSADTQILTSGGYFPIVELKDKEVQIWNGNKMSNVVIRQTSTEPVECYTVRLSNGGYLNCTSGHKWIMLDGTRKETKYLKIGDYLSICNMPVVQGDCELFNARKLGIRFARNKNPDVDDIPIRHNLQSRLDWFAGFISAYCGSPIFAYAKRQNIQSGIRHIISRQVLITYELHILQRFQLFFNLFGIYNLPIQNNFSSIYINFTKKILFILEDMGFTTNLSVADDPEQYAMMKELKIISKVYNENCLTYCFNEPISHSGIFNGIYTGQSEVYSKMITTYIKEPVKRDKLRNAIISIPCIKRKACWAKKWIESKTATLGERIIAFAIFEGVFFSGAFCCIFWLKEQGKMPGLAKGNEFIARDEGLHTDFACLLFRKYIKCKPSYWTFKEIMTEAVGIELEFINHALPCKLLNMNSESMIEYIKFVANRLTKQLGYDEIYNATQPFPFMDRICLMNKTSFFESDTTEYSKQKEDEENPYDGAF